jgi:hypothetical protein
MMFYQFGDNSSYERRWVYASGFEPTSHVVDWCCPKCGRAGAYPAGSFDVELEGGSQWPDFLACGEYPLLIVSERVVRVWSEAGIASFQRFPVGIRGAARGCKVDLKAAPKYFRIEITGQCNVDFPASGQRITGVCTRCGQLKWRGNPDRRFKLLEGSWDGSDLFRDIARFPCVTFCTQKAADVMRSSGLTNLALDVMGVDEDVERLATEGLLKDRRAADDAVQRLEKLALRRAECRAEATEALRRIALEGKGASVRYFARHALVAQAEPGDREAAAFFREHLSVPDLCLDAVRGLLKIEGEMAYADVVAVVADTKQTLENRGEAVWALARHANQPFARRLRREPEEWREEDLLLPEVNAWAKAGFPEARPGSLEKLKLAFERLGCKAPADYLKFLKSRVEAEYSDRWGTWRLPPVNELLETVCIDRYKGPYFRQLVGCAKALAGVRKKGATVDEKGKPYPLERVEGGLAIGDDHFGDILFLDPSDRFSVWVLCRTIGEVCRTAPDFKTWLAKAKKEED